MNEWRTRPLELVYAFVYLDYMHYKVREGGSMVTRAIYNILAVNLQGQKDLIGMYVSQKVREPSFGSQYSLTSRIEVCKIC
jgi:putative transposase